MLLKGLLPAVSVEGLSHTGVAILVISIVWALSAMRSPSQVRIRVRARVRVRVKVRVSG